MTSNSSDHSNPNSENHQAEPISVDRTLLNLLAVVGMSLLILVLLYLILRILAGILQPLFVAIFICYLIVPAHHWLVARRIPSSISYMIILGGFMAAMLTAGGLAYQGVKALSEEMPKHINDVRKKVDDTSLLLRKSFEDLLPHHGQAREQDEDTNKLRKGEDDPLALAISTQPEAVPVDPEAVDDARDRTSAEVASSASTQPAEVASSASTQPAEVPLPASSQPATDAVNRWISTQTLVDWGQTVIDPLFGFVTSTLVVVFYLVFLLAEVAGFQKRLVNAFGAVRAHRIQQVVTSINTAISHYIVVKTLVSLMVAAISTTILLAFNVKYAVIWGILTFFANYIPYVGSMVAVILPVIMHFALTGFSAWLMVMLVLLVGAQSVIGSILEPRMIGRRLGVSPLIILLGLAFWGTLWGIPGMVLSAPLMVVTKIILENIEPTRPLAKLISDV